MKADCESKTTHYTWHPLYFRTGNQQAVSLSRALGRQPLLIRWTAGPYLPALSHLCALHPVSVHPSTSLLCPFGGFPGSLSLGGQRAWQVKKLKSLSLQMFVSLLEKLTVLQLFSLSVPRAVTHQVKAMDVTTRPWPKLFRSTRTPCAPCTLPESTQLPGRRGWDITDGTHYPPLSHCQL